VVVVDCGSSICKVGLAGDETPTVFPTVMGRAMHAQKVFVGHEALANRNVVDRLVYPVERGMVVDWDSMEFIWRHIFYTILNVAPEEHPVVLCETLLTPKAQREKALRLLFETFNVPSVYVTSQAAFSLYETGRVTGLVLEIAHPTRTRSG